MAQKSRWHASPIPANGAGVAAANVSLRRLDQVLNDKVAYLDDDLTFTGTVTFTGPLAVNPGPLIIGTDPGGSEILRVGGTGRFSGLLVSHTGPEIDLIRTGSAADEKRWDWFVAATTMQFRAVDDANSVGVAWVRTTRSGTAITAIELLTSGELSLGLNGQVNIDGTAAELALNPRGGGGSAWELYVPATATFRLYHAGDQYIFNDTEFTPSASGGKTLGTAALPWGDLRSSGVLYLSASAAKVVPGATSLAFRNTADSANNLLITDAGVVTFRNTVSGITTLTATTFLSDAANPASAGVVRLANQANISWRNQANTANFSLQLDGANAFRFDSDVTLNGGLTYQIAAVQVVTSRRTGYTNAMTGTANRATAYDTSTITLVQLAERVKALQDDLTTHGLIGA